MDNSFKCTYIIFYFNEGESYLEEGEHVYPFSVSLPLQLPSSFNGEHGHVRYTTKVVIDIPWGKDKEQEKVFEVISPLNLNDEPSLAVSSTFILNVLLLFLHKLRYCAVLYPIPLMVNI